MKHAFLSSLLTAGLLAFSTAFSSAQTRLRMDMSGVFDFEGSPANHPDIDIGDSFTFFLEFDDSAVLYAGTPNLAVHSILAGGLKVNGSDHSFVLPEFIYLQGDQPPFPPTNRPGSAAIMALVSPPGPSPILNAVSTNWATVSSVYPSAAGPTLEYSEIPLWNSMDPASMLFLVQGTAHSSYVRGPLNAFSVTAVPEPAGAVLGGVAALGMIMRRRR